MVRQHFLAIMLATFAMPATASADLFGLYAKGHGGLMKTDRSLSWQTGAELAVQFMGLEAFADMRFIEGHFADMESDWFWNRIGMRFPMGLPIHFGADEATILLDAAYIASNAPFDPSEAATRTLYRGFGVGGGLRLDWNLFSVFWFGIQAEAGYHYLFERPKDPAGPNLGALSYLKLDF